MFSGIIEELGIVKKILRNGNLMRIEISVKRISSEVKSGDSISVNGACLTAVEVKKDAFVFEAIPETLKVTNLKDLTVSDKVNLERSLKVGDRISGHFVLGHIDCIGVIRRRYYNSSGNLNLEISIPVRFLRYCLPKGSIAVDGISLTIAEIKNGSITVYIIPHTLKNTTLYFRGPSDRVNIEFDILAKKQE